MPSEWYYAIDRIKKGPVAEVELRRLVACGMLKRIDLVWQEQLPDWINAEDVNGLFAGIQLSSQSSTTSSQSGNLIQCQDCNKSLSKHAKECPQCGAPNNWVHPEIARFLASVGHFPSLPEFKCDHDRYVLQGWDVRSRNCAETTSNLLSSFSLATPLTKKGLALQAATLLGSSFLNSCMSQSVKAFVIDFSTSPPTYHTTDDAHWRPVLKFFGFQTPPPTPPTRSRPQAHRRLNGLVIPVVLIVAGLVLILATAMRRGQVEPDVPNQQIAINNFPAPLDIPREKPEQNAQRGANEITLPRFKHPQGVAENEMPSPGHDQASEQAQGIDPATAAAAGNAQVNAGGANPATVMLKPQGQAVSQPRPFIPGVTRKPQMEPVAKPNEEHKKANSDPIPEKINDYFERAERIRLSRIKSLETTIDELRFAVTNVRAELKPQKRRELSLTEKALAELKKFQRPTAPLPLPLAVGDIGYYEILFAVSIWDETTISAQMYDESQRFVDAVPGGDYKFRIKPGLDPERENDQHLIIKGVDTGPIAKIKPDGFSRRIWPSIVMLRVIATAPDEEMLKLFPERERGQMRLRVVLEPIKKPAEFERFRDVFNQRSKVVPSDEPHAK